MSKASVPAPGTSPAIAVEVAILDQMVGDLQRGELRETTDYEAAFPGYERHVEAIHQSLTAKVPDLQKMRHAPVHTVGGFTLIRELAHGGQGVVYLAKDPQLGRLVAVKLLTAWSVLRPEAVGRLLREAELASRVEHPGVCTIYASGMEGDLPYIVMRYVAGSGLREWAAHVPRDSRVGRNQILRVIEQVARALHLAHLQGIIHRDIKTGNIRVTPEGQPVLLDFGLARRLEDDAHSLTGSGDMVGTPAYMAPEQVDPKGRLPDARTDVFSLGVTLFELLTDRRPFEGSTIDSTFKAILDGVLPNPRSLSPVIDGDLKVILETTLERDPARRYVSAEALADDIKRYLEHRPISAKPAGVFLRLRRWYDRGPALAVALTVAVLCLIGGLVSTLHFLDKVTDERNRANRKTREYGHLAAGRSLDTLIAEVNPTFLQARPDRVPEIESWLRRARELTAPLPEYRATLERMRLNSVPGTPETTPGAGPLLAPMRELENRRERLRLARASGFAEGAEWDSVVSELNNKIAALEQALEEVESREFELPAEAWHYEQLASLVERLQSFETGTDTVPGIADVERALVAALEVEELTLVKTADAWAQARSEVAGDTRFEGFVLEPLLGLIPLGADLDSGFQEFAVYGSGEIPRRSTDGVLLLTEEAAAVLVLLPGGELVLGAKLNDPLRVSNEVPRRVRLAPFLIGKHEVTQAQWQRVTGKNPAAYSPTSSGNPNPITLRNPVESVTWHASSGFAKRLGLDMPTEAQWEYACLAGSSERLAWGHDLEELRGRENVGDRSLTIPGFEPAPWNDGYAVHAAVGSFEANAFGLYDMHGNVTEWSRDWYRMLPLTLEGVTPDSGLDLSAHGPNRSFRGGSWYANPRFARASIRNQMDPTLATAVNGMRLSRDL